MLCLCFIVPAFSQILALFFPRYPFHQGKSEEEDDVVVDVVGVDDKNAPKGSSEAEPEPFP